MMQNFPDSTKVFGNQVLDVRHYLAAARSHYQDQDFTLGNYAAVMILESCILSK